jgi:hypothetical protein
MQKKIAIASIALALGLGASAAHAQQTLAGSDTLRDLTTQMLIDCPSTGTGSSPAGDLSYIGGGSGNGENAMVLGTNPANQWVAPMSRNLKTSVVSGSASLHQTACNSESASTNPGTAQGINMGLDGVSVVRRESSIDTANSNAKACDTLAYSTTIDVTDGSGDGTCPGCTASTTTGHHNYVLSDWRDVLRIVYGGFTNDTIPSTDKPYNPCKRQEPGRSAATGAQDCNSDVRNALVNKWGNLFQNQSCADKALGTASSGCTQLKHAFRRSDSSGTTDVFTVLLSMPSQSSTVSPYCSGHDQLDSDPIRRVCAGTGNLGAGLGDGEQVCQPRDAKALVYPTNNRIALKGGTNNDSTPWNPAVDNTGDLGLVQTVLIPEGAETQAANKTPCKFGTFGLTAMPDSDQLSGVRCPNGTPQVLLKCFFPKDASGNYGCLNSSVNVPQIGELKTIDGRAYNKILRSGNDPDTNIVADKNGVQVTGAYYRIHQSTVMPGADTAGAVACNENDSTSQIGCLVQASPCSIGFAGREAANNTTIANNDVRSLNLPIADATGVAQPTDADVRLLLSGTCTAGGTSTFAQRYPLSRRLWLNSVVGFGSSSIPTTQKNLAACWQDRYYSDNLIKKYGFITLDDDPGHCSKSDPSTVGAGQTACKLAIQPASVVCQ